MTSDLRGFYIHMTKACHIGLRLTPGKGLEHMAWIYKIPISISKRFKQGMMLNDYEHEEKYFLKWKTSWMNILHNDLGQN